jgi:hypothetical protein
MHCMEYIRTCIHTHARQKAEAIDKRHELSSRHALADRTAVTKVGAVIRPMIRDSIHAATLPPPSHPPRTCIPGAQPPFFVGGSLSTFPTRPNRLPALPACLPCLLPHTLTGGCACERAHGHAAGQRAND